MSEPEQLQLRGLYHGSAPTETERESGAQVEVENLGPLKPNHPGHRMLWEFASAHDRMTSYEASYRASGDWHRYRREATRLLVRGFLIKDGVLANYAPGGRPHVDSYRITPAGEAELVRLGAPE